MTGEQKFHFHFQFIHSHFILVPCLIFKPHAPPSALPCSRNLSAGCQRLVLFRFSSLSVSSFVKKTTEKINTLQMNSELRQKPDSREGGQADNAAAPPEDLDSEYVWSDPGRTLILWTKTASLQGQS